MSVSKVLFQSNSDEWATPQHIFDLYDSEFNFNLDVCASEDNHKCDTYFSKDDDGLTKDWGGTEYGAILHIAKLINGLRKRTGRLEKITHW